MNTKGVGFGLFAGFFGLILALLRHYISLSESTQTILLVLLLVTVAAAVVLGIVGLVSGNEESRKAGIASVLVGLAALIMCFMLGASTVTVVESGGKSWAGSWINDKDPEVKLDINASGMCTYYKHGTISMIAPYTLQNNAVALYSPSGLIEWKIVSKTDKNLVLKIDSEDTAFHKQ